MNPAPHPDVDRLLSEAGWARALARSLVRDVHAADDLGQRAYVAALERPPEPGTPVRRWLAAVMRNFAISDARTASRRAVRERASARGDSVPPADPVDEGLALQERLLHAVRELPEPYRSTVWARYYDGLAPREIAARAGVPVKTVKTRLARGLDALRARFDREHGGDRSAWVLAFLPFVEPRSWSAWTLGTLLVDAKLKIAVAVALVAGGIGLWMLAQGPLERAEGVSVVRTTGAEAALAAPQPPVQRAEVAEEHAVAEEPEVRELTLDDVLGPAHAVRGRVVDTEQQPVPGVPLVDAWQRKPRVEDGRPVVSAADGTFQLKSHAEVDMVAAQGPGWVPLYSSRGGSGAGEAVVVVAREARFAGHVRDADGNPVERVTVNVQVEPELRRELSSIVPGATLMAQHAETDAEGRFEFPSAPIVRGRLVASVPGLEDAAVEIPGGSRDDIQITFAAPSADTVLVRGVVVDAAGQPAEGAWVSVEDLGTSARTRADGSFVLQTTHDELRGAAWTTRSVTPPAGPKPLELRAVREGSLPARQVLPPLDELPTAAAATEFRLVLGGPALRIAGVVVDAEGRPLGDVQIERQGGTSFGRVRDAQGGLPGEWDATFEELMASSEGWRPAATDTEGRFEVVGLLDGAYALQVSSREHMTSTTTEPIRAGTGDVRIVLDVGGPRVRIGGRVVDREGNAVPGARLALRARPHPGEDSIAGPMTLADAQGRFTFETRTTEGLLLDVQAAGFRYTSYEPPAGARLGELVVLLQHEVRLQVDLGDRPDLADGFELLDERGEPMTMHLIRSQMTENSSQSSIQSVTRVPIQDGRSEVLTLAEGERTVVLYHGPDEVARLPARLAPGDVNVVRP